MCVCTVYFTKSTDRKVESFTACRGQILLMRMQASTLQYEEIGNETESEKILNKFLVNDEHSVRYVRVNGVVTMPETFKKLGDRIQRMDVRDYDIFICSYPRTGNTWVSEMVWCVANALDFEGAKSALQGRVPYLESTGVIQPRPNLSLPDFLTDSLKYVEDLKSPRIIKSHLPLSLLPEKLRNFSTGAKIIYVFRDPKDTCVSCYNLWHGRGHFTGDFDSFCKLFLNDLLRFAPFWEHVLGFWALNSNPNVLFLKYEEMKKDLPSVIRKTASFLGKSLSDEQVSSLEDHLSFESMKKNPAVNFESLKRYNIPVKEGSFIRSGTVGGWKAVMTQEVVSQFDDWSRKKLAGSDFQLAT